MLPNAQQVWTIDWIPMIIEAFFSVPHSDAFEIADLDRTNIQNSQPALVLTSHALQPLMRSLGPREEVCTEFAKELRRRTPNEPAQWTWWFSVSGPWTVNKLALIAIHLLSDVAERVDMLGQSSPRANFPITSWLKYKTFLNSKCKQFAFLKTYHLCISSCSLTSYFRWDVTIASSCRLPIRSRFKVRPGHQFVNCFSEALDFVGPFMCFLLFVQSQIWYLRNLDNIGTQKGTNFACGIGTALKCGTILGGFRIGQFWRTKWHEDQHGSWITTQWWNNSYHISSIQQSK